MQKTPEQQGIEKLSADESDFIPELEKDPITGEYIPERKPYKQREWEKLTEYES